MLKKCLTVCVMAGLAIGLAAAPVLAQDAGGSGSGGTSAGASGGGAAAPRTGAGARPRTSGVRPRIGTIRPRVEGIRPSVTGVRPDVRGVRPNIKGVIPGRPRSTTRDNRMVEPQPSLPATSGAGPGVTFAPGGVPNVFSPNDSPRERLDHLLDNAKNPPAEEREVIASGFTPWWCTWSCCIGKGVIYKDASGPTAIQYAEMIRRGYDDRYAYNESIYGTEISVDPEMLSRGLLPASMQAPVELPPRATVELAREAARDGRLDDAITHYQAQLGESPEDAGAMRELALVLLMDKRDDDGVAMMLMAYRTMPEMGAYPAWLDEIGLDASRARAIVQRQVGRAHRIGSAADFLAATVVMQGQRRAAPAQRMLKEAEDAGLDAAIVENLRRALEAPVA